MITGSRPQFATDQTRHFFMTRVLYSDCFDSCNFVEILTTEVKLGLLTHQYTWSCGPAFLLNYFTLSSEYVVGYNRFSLVAKLPRDVHVFRTNHVTPG